MTRLKVVALVGGLSALGGAVAGAVAAIIAAVVYMPNAEFSISAAQIALIVAQNALFAGVAGSVLGTVVAFGALRRVPLGKLLLYTNAGLAAGFTASWFGGLWGYNNFSVLGLIGFSVGAVLARVLSRGSPSSSSANATIASESQALNELPAAPVDLSTQGDRVADRVRRNAP